MRDLVYNLVVDFETSSTASIDRLREAEEHLRLTLRLGQVEGRLVGGGQAALMVNTGKPVDCIEELMLLLEAASFLPSAIFVRTARPECSA